MKNITLTIFILFLCTFTGCTVRVKTNQPRNPQRNYPYQQANQPPRTTKLHFHYKDVQKKFYFIPPPTAFPLRTPSKPKKLR